MNATGITITKANYNFVFGAGFYTRDGRYSSEFISNYLDVYVKDALKRVPGVGDVMIFGERKYAMRVWLDPVRLAARGLTATDVVNALVEQNVEIPAGQLGQPPSDSKQAFQIPVRVVGRLTSPDEFDNIIVKNSPNGLVLLKDVGHSEVGAEDYSSDAEILRARCDGHRRQQLSNANALEVDRKAKAALAELSKSFPPGLEYAIAFDSTTVVGDSIREVLITLAEAIVIVITVIFLFLLDWRATIIPAVTIPVSLIGTFAFIKLFGFSINSLTLFGITLATGLVVDDAIVVIENVQRHIAHGALRPARGHIARHGRGDQRGHRHIAGADRRLRAGLVLPRHHRHSLPAVLADHRLLHRHLGLQRAHAFAGAVGPVPARRRGSSPAAGLSAHPPGLARLCRLHSRRRCADHLAGQHLRARSIHVALQLRYLLLVSSSPAWAPPCGSTSTFPPASFPRRIRAT